MLNRIHSPRDLKALTAAERRELAAEIRAELIQTVSQTGGHLASNLGSVELTIALHTVFDAPEDCIVFDVGHQAYTHKILTGRAGRMCSLRQKGGLSGFPRLAESQYDVNCAGHASDAISVALGLARARDLRGENHRVVAVVGDGALTGGLCYEALNDAGQRQTSLMIVLNDNAMSISRNVGAMSAHLTHMRQSGVYLSFKQALRRLLGRIPRVGNRLFRLLSRLRDSLRSLFIADTFFDSLNIEYLGPIDGHDTEEMIRTFARAREMKEPVVIHVVTRKGCGYQPAENQPERFHGVAPFMVETGEAYQEGGASSGTIAAEELIRRARTDGRIACLSAAMLNGTGMEDFAKAFPERCFDVGIAEAHEITMASGLALGGMKPYAAIYSTFLQRAYDHVMMEMCLNRAPLTLLIDRAGLNGADGETHQGVYDLAFLRAMPNLIVAAPRDGGELRALLRLSFAVEAPMAIRYPKSLADTPCAEPMEIGKWHQLREGSDLSLIACGRMVDTALAVSANLEARGIEARVINARFIKPMDEAMLARVAAERAPVITLEDGVVAGGFGEGVRRALPAGLNVFNVGVPDRFIAHASVKEQMQECEMDAESVTALALRALGKENYAHSRG